MSTVVNITYKALTKPKNGEKVYKNVHDWLEHPNHVYIGSANEKLGLRASKWANPFIVRMHKMTLDKSLQLYKSHILDLGLDKDLMELDGKKLGALCSTEDCSDSHGYVLLELLKEYKLGKINELRNVLDYEYLLYKQENKNNPLTEEDFILRIVKEDQKKRKKDAPWEEESSPGVISTLAVARLKEIAKNRSIFLPSGEEDSEKLHKSSMTVEEKENIKEIEKVNKWKIVSDVKEELLSNTSKVAGSNLPEAELEDGVIYKGVNYDESLIGEKLIERSRSRIKTIMPDVSSGNDTNDKEDLPNNVDKTIEDFRNRFLSLAAEIFPKYKDEKIKMISLCASNKIFYDCKYGEKMEKDIDKLLNNK